MSVTTNNAPEEKTRSLRRIWKVPVSHARWYWLLASIGLYGTIFAWYYRTIKTQTDPAPIDDPLRTFGIVAFVLVLGTASYSLRRRFVRGLPGKVQSWLWMHTWLGITTILIALMHENFNYITHNFCQNATCLTDTYWAGGALFSLIFLVISGITGRLLDIWQARIIANEASSNGVGIVGALEERMLELEYTVERLCAGKSDPFKSFCMLALQHAADDPGSPDQLYAALSPRERADFQQAYATLINRAQLRLSYRRQLRARLTIRVWRTVHIILACIALLVISYHGTMELLTNVFHFITPA